jgi:integrase
MLAVFYKEDGRLENPLIQIDAEDMIELIKAGEWDALNNMPVGFDEKGAVTCHWKDNKWINPLWIKGSEEGLSGFITDTTRHLSSDFINEFKSIAYIMIYISTQSYAISTVATRIGSHKKAARYLFTLDIHSFGGLTDQIWKDYQRDVKQTNGDNPALNNLREYSDELPFYLQLDKPDTVKHEHKQNPVVPERLYIKWGRNAGGMINKWSKKQAQLSQFIAEQIELYESAEKDIVENIRAGKTSMGRIYNEAQAGKRISSFLSELEEQGIPLLDNNENSQWLPLFKKHNLWVNGNGINHHLKFKAHVYDDSTTPVRSIVFGSKTFESFDEFNKLLVDLMNNCIYLIFTLSGMRENELIKLYPEYGAQTVNINGHDIHLFHTGQQKITEGYQAKKDVFVTTELGHKAYNLLNAICEPFRNKFMRGKNGKRPFLVSINMRSPKAVSSINRKFSDFKSKLTKADVENLKVSEYGSKKFNYKVGDYFNFTSHMARRSLAYYLVALELCGFPQIKQQFSHMSLAMSIYYAKNASRKNNLVLYDDIENERDTQLALVLLRLKERATHQKLSGGKGGSWNAKGDKVMSFEYYKSLIHNGDEFVTAVAPGLYCTNRNCCKTAQLSLVHDVSCGTSIVENISWVELQRSTSINLIESLHAMGELTEHDVSKEMMNIRAAQVMINKHLGEGSIAEYEPPEAVRRILFQEVS